MDTVTPKMTSADESENEKIEKQTGASERMFEQICKYNSIFQHNWNFVSMSAIDLKNVVEQVNLLQF